MTVSEDKKTSEVDLREGLAQVRARFKWGRVCYTLLRFDRARQWRVRQGENVLIGVARDESKWGL